MANAQHTADVRTKYTLITYPARPSVRSESKERLRSRYFGCIYISVELLGYTALVCRRNTVSKHSSRAV
jgi:hypothetical protein